MMPDSSTITPIFRKKKKILIDESISQTGKFIHRLRRRNNDDYFNDYWNNQHYRKRGKMNCHLDSIMNCVDQLQVDNEIFSHSLKRRLELLRLELNFYEKRQIENQYQQLYHCESDDRDQNQLLMKIVCELRENKKIINKFQQQLNEMKQMDSHKSELDFHDDSMEKFRQNYSLSEVNSIKEFNSLESSITNSLLEQYKQQNSLTNTSSNSLFDYKNIGHNQRIMNIVYRLPKKKIQKTKSEINRAVGWLTKND